MGKLAILAVLIVMIATSAIIATTVLNGFYSFLFSLGYVGTFTSGFIGTSSLMIFLFPPPVVVLIL